MAEQKGINHRMIAFMVDENVWGYELAVCPACGREHYIEGPVLFAPSKRNFDSDPEEEIMDLVCPDCIKIAGKVLGRDTMREILDNDPDETEFWQDTIVQIVQMERGARPACNA